MNRQEALALDPVTLEIVWNGLRSAVDESFIALMRAAFSTNIKERHDHSTAIADAEGRLIVQAENALPIHLASMSGLLAILVEKYGETMRPGDLYVANDPHVAGGTHLPDIAMAMPVFEGERRVGFVANLAHHADVGGAVKSSMAGGLTEIYQEGLRIPVLRLQRAGELDRELLDLMLLNMRLPAERRGDLNAQIAAARLSAKRLGEMVEARGAGLLARAFEEIRARSGARMRAAIADLPDGTWEFEDLLDGDGTGVEDIRIRLAVTCAGERIRFDFSGTDPQVPGNVNLTLNAIQSAACYALKALLDPDMPNNQGVIDAIEVVAPEGTLANCRPPAAVALRANTSQRVVDVILGALAPVIPERVVAAANGANTSAVFAGTDYIYFETLGGGMGARFAKDGKDGVQVHITNTSNLPVEAIEMEYPLRVEAYELVRDSGGAGRQRGGMGLRRVITPVDHTTEFSGVGERFRHPPWGLDGGRPGGTGRFRIRRADGDTETLPGKITGVRCRAGEAVIIETPGAGGYGPPGERAAEAVAADLRGGKISPGFAARYYPQAAAGDGPRETNDPDDNRETDR